MVKLIIFWAVLIMSSPFIVLIGQSQFQEAGWLAIGGYSFDVYEGLYRSFYFYLITLPVIAAAFLGRPKQDPFEAIKIRVISRVGRRHVFLMIVFCLIAFYFNLGITGVETLTEFRLSGIAYYIRAYLFLFLIAVYIFSSTKMPFFWVVIYSFVAGLTGGSRFVGVAPLVLLLMRNLIDNNWKIINKYNLFIAIALFSCFSLITASRLVLYADDYSFSTLLEILKSIDLGEVEVIFQGFSQFFLRIGIGRDVILSYEVAASGACSDLWGLFLMNGSCPNPPLDFYGIELDSHRFYLAPPMLSSLFVASNEFGLKLFISLCYSLVTFFMCYSISGLRKIPLGKYFVQPAYFLVVMLVTIGPIFYSWILIALIGTVFLFAGMIGSIKVHLLRQRNT